MTREISVSGGTVRRPAGYWTPAVHALLTHLHRVGFDQVPRAIGIDGAVEIVSFVDGETLVPPAEVDTEMLVSVAELLRRYHAAAASFSPPNWASWQRTSIPTAGRLVCHNDLCMTNVVFRGRKAVGIIDFDFAHPADPLWDLAMAAWHWLPVSYEVMSDEIPERLRLFVDAYGVAAQQRSTVFDILLDLVGRMRDKRIHDPRAAERFDKSLSALESRRTAVLDALK